MGYYSALERTSEKCYNLDKFQKPRDKKNKPDTTTDHILHHRGRKQTGGLGIWAGVVLEETTI